MERSNSYLEDLVKFDTISQSFEDHYNKHSSGESDVSDDERDLLNVSREEYNEIADKLSETPANSVKNSSSRIVGYVAKNGYKVKYDRQTGYLVVYNDDKAISLYKTDDYRFMHKLYGSGQGSFKSELPENIKESETLEKIYSFELLHEKDVEGLDLKMLLNENIEVNNRLYFIDYDEDCNNLVKNIEMIRRKLNGKKI